MNQTLSLWRETPTRRAILEYVQAVATPGSPDFVPPADRIATFDNDGTLWCEKPGYIQLYFAIQRLKELAAADPSLLLQPSYKAAAEGDLAYFEKIYPDDVPEVLKLVYDTHAGITQDEFETLASEFLSRSCHPRFGVPFKQLVYQPMIELVRYLEAHDFKVFIATAGGMTFVRTVSEEIYGISRERVIGSNIGFEIQTTVRGMALMRKAGLIEPLGDGPGKPVNIELHIGRKPILAAGNANGDLEMFLYSQTARYRSLQLLLHHDDDAREYSYDHKAEKVLQAATERAWQVISMRDDFAHVFNLPVGITPAESRKLTG